MTRQNADIVDTLQLREVTMAATFWLRVGLGYNFGCMIASDTLFDSRSWFSGPGYPMKTLPRSELLHVGDCQVGHCPTF